MARIVHPDPIRRDGEPRRWAISARVTGHDLADDDHSSGEEWRNPDSGYGSRIAMIHGRAELV